MEPGSWVTSWGRATFRAGLLISAWACNRKRHFSLFCRCIFGDLCYSSKLTCTITNAILIKMFPELIFEILRPPYPHFWCSKNKSGIPEAKEFSMSQQCSWLFISTGSASADSTNSGACDWLNPWMQNLGIQSISWDPFCTRVLSVWGFWYLQRLFEPIFHRYQGKTVYFYTVGYQDIFHN